MNEKLWIVPRPRNSKQKIRRTVNYNIYFCTRSVGILSIYLGTVHCTGILISFYILIYNIDVCTVYPEI